MLGVARLDGSTPQSIPAPRLTWDDALTAQAGLGQVERGVVLLLARLPLAPVSILVPLLGPRQAVDAAVARLHEAGLVGAIMPPPLRARRRERLWYLTDLGLCVVALDRRVEPRSLAERLRLRQRDLVARLGRAGAYLATYELLAVTARAGEAIPTLLGWEQP